jgi:multidrug resistance protein, MATE family
MFATVVTSVLHAGFLVMFLKTFNLGILGIIYASTLTNSIQLLIILIYAWMKQSIKDAIFWPDLESFKDWKLYLALSIPSTMMICGECWFYEIVTIMSGYIGVNEQAVMVILVNLFLFLVCFSMGFSEALGTVVGNSIGENNVPKAKKYFKLAAMAGLPCIYAWISCFYIFRA